MGDSSGFGKVRDHEGSRKAALGKFNSDTEEEEACGDEAC